MGLILLSVVAIGLGPTLLFATTLLENLVSSPDLPVAVNESEGGT